MEKTIMTTYPITLSLLTPVIINNGQIYGPLELFMLDDGRQYVLNPSAVLTALGPQANQCVSLLSQAIARPAYSNDALKTAADMIKGKLNRPCIRRPCEFLDKAKEKLKSNPLQQVQAHMVKPLTSKPYIPGSSVKGAIRTAILEKLRAEKNLSPNYKERVHDFENRILGIYRVNEDPFKYLKISDFEITDMKTQTKIGLVNARGKNPVYTGMTDAWCLHQEKGESVTNTVVQATGTISFASDASRYHFLAPAYIKDAIYNFYIDMWNAKVRHSDLPSGVQNILKTQLTKAIQAGDYLIRIGHYSGIENMTFNVDNPDRKHMGHPEINSEGDSHYALIENMYPAGLCIMHWGDPA